MMNWNSNDTKYIIKRIILYFIIAGIVFFAGQSCAKAFSTVSTYRYYNASDFTQSSTAFQSVLIEDHAPRMEGVGTGTLTTSFLIYTFANEYPQITSISAQTSIGIYACDIGSIQYYKDSNVQYVTITPVCPLMMGNGYFRGFYFTGYFPKDTVWKGGYVISFVQEDNAQDLSQVVAQQQSTTTAILNAAQVAHADNQAIQQAISNEITAINNQTTAINNQTQWFEEQHDPLIDTGFLDVMGDLITTNDSDVVRQFILIPFNLFVQIYNACTSNTCSALTLGTLYGTTLTLPCINWTTLVGSAIANTIDIIFSACLIFGMYRMIKHMINKIFTLSSTITDECGVEVFK